MLDSLLLMLKPLMQNPILGGSVSLLLTGAIGWFLVKLPMQIVNLIRNNFTVYLTLDSANTLNHGSSESFANFLRYWSENDFWRYSRTGQVFDSYNADGVVKTPSIGPGTHLFIIGGRLYWLQFIKHENTLSERVKSSIVISTFGTKLNVIVNLFNKITQYCNDDDDKLVYILNGCERTRVGIAPKRRWETVIINKEVKAHIDQCVKNFLNNREWYLERGIPYKLVVMLHGVPGCGKTSLLKALAHRYNLNIGIVNINNETNNTFHNTLLSAEKNSLITIEDLDSLNSTHRREGVYEEPVMSNYGFDRSTGQNVSGGVLKPIAKPNETIGYKPLSISSILNALDGIVELDGQIIFISTNCFDKLDPALVRKGRVDHVVELTPLTHSEIIEYIILMYKPTPAAFTVLIAAYKFKPITGADLQALYMATIDKGYNDFIDSIPNELDEHQCSEVKEIVNYKNVSNKGTYNAPT